MSVNRDSPRCETTWPIRVLRGGQNALDPRLNQIVVQRVVTEGGGDISQQKILSLFVQVSALGRVEFDISLACQIIELGVHITLALSEGCVRAPINAQPVLRIWVVCAPALASQQWEGLGIFGDGGEGGGINR